jgi:acyl-CoA thioester hydrolase
MNAQPFSVPLTVRRYETDMNGHAYNTVYLEWADHARTEFLRRAGLQVESFLARKTAPVILEAHIRYLAELRAGEEIDVTCEPSYGSGRTMTVRHRFLRHDGDRPDGGNGKSGGTGRDGTDHRDSANGVDGADGDGRVAAELTQVLGMLDHVTRRLNADPHRMLRSLAAEPDLLEPAEPGRPRPGP